jgi:hypothetical protein
MVEEVMSELFTDLPADNTAGIRHALTVRRAFVGLFALVGVFGLANAFGQETSEATASGQGATLRLSAPERVRGGLFFQSRIEVTTSRRIAHPRFVLDRGWTEGMQVNSIEPAAVSEASRDGRVVLSYDTLEAGDRLRVWLQFEVDPTAIGKRPYGLELDDEATPLTRIDRDIRVLP